MSGPSDNILQTVDDADLPPGWRYAQGIYHHGHGSDLFERYERVDGAVVSYDFLMVNINLTWRPGHRGYQAWPPEGDRTLGGFRKRPRHRGHSRFWIPRKWRSALAAMRAVDKEYPMKEGPE